MVNYYSLTIVSIFPIVSFMRIFVYGLVVSNDPIAEVWGTYVLYVVYEFCFLLFFKDVHVFYFTV